MSHVECVNITTEHNALFLCIKLYMYLFIYTLKNSTFFEELMVKLKHIILDKRQNMSHRST